MPMILSRQRMLQVEEQTIARGVPADLLMESAGAKLARCAGQFFPDPGLVVCYAGKGHNAGDAFVAARHLAEAGWRVLVRSPWNKADFAPLTRRKFDLLGAEILAHPLQPSVPLDGPLLLLDALVGLGASGRLREPLAALAAEMNALRLSSGASTLAVDAPSGLDVETGIPGDACVRADITATVGFAKKGLVADAATDFVGRLAVLDIPEFGEPDDDAPAVITAPLLRRSWAPRDFDTNKGRCGRVVLLAGSRGTLGAAHLCAAGAVRGGAGLVSLGATPDSYELLATTAIPEVMVRPFKALTDVFTLQVDALGIGPGLGDGREAHTLRLVREAPCPTVVDADALTIVAHAGLQHLDDAVAPRLLTPHPGEMQRLLAGKKIKDRAQTAADFVRQHQVTLLLKGARTVIAEKDRPLRFNTTGNPGMATGGMGDVLTGVCTALLGQQTDTYTAASIGAWVCGRAAEIAVSHGGCSEESLAPSDVLAHLGRAFDSLRAGDF
ncbi:MAG: NAD(P)H-hydrate dehydratase [Chthoniobacterales bacterium]